MDCKTKRIFKNLNNLKIYIIYILLWKRVIDKMILFTLINRALGLLHLRVRSQCDPNINL